MVAHCIDVGQADATLLEFPCGAILVDAGAQDDAALASLLSYLEAFFSRRADLERTLDAIIITHNHIDHTRGLKEVVEQFNVRRYIDNGQLEGRGTEDPRWVRNNSHEDGRAVTILEITEDEVAALPQPTGLTSDDIDPLACPICDPRIVVLSGRWDRDPGWRQEDFDNKNNHSLVVRVDLGEASFLFSGDLQEPAIETLVETYEGSDMLDVDVWHVGHHRSHNATTPSLLSAMTPDIAVISMGKWNYGMGSSYLFTTWAYGHPRKVTIDGLSSIITRNRSQSGRFKVAEGPGRFHDYTVRRAIYGTGWDGTVKVFATPSEDFRVIRGN